MGMPVGVGTSTRGVVVETGRGETATVDWMMTGEIKEVDDEVVGRGLGVCVGRPEQLVRVELWYPGKPDEGLGRVVKDGMAPDALVISGTMVETSVGSGSELVTTGSAASVLEATTEETADVPTSGMETDPEL